MTTKCEPISDAKIGEYKRTIERLNAESEQALRSAKKEINEKIDNAIIRIVRALAEI